MEKLSWFPKDLREVLILYRNKYRKVWQKRELIRLSRQPIKKIIIGACNTKFNGWKSVDREVLDLLVENNWLNYFKPNSIDAILAEHVWEHLTPDEAILAAKICFKFLKPGEGYLRVAVPDGFHPDPNYIMCVKPCGSGYGADDHKVLYTYRSLVKIFASVGFDVFLLEYFDEQGKFHYMEWNISDGFIQRSKRFDYRNVNGVLSYTSIILDARKPYYKCPDATNLSAAPI